MPTQVLNPNATHDAPQSIDGGSGTAHAALSDSDDATHVNISSGGDSTFEIGFGTFSLPTAAVIKSVEIQFRYFGVSFDEGMNIYLKNGTSTLTSWLDVDTYEGSNWRQYDDGYSNDTPLIYTGTVTQSTLDNIRARFQTLDNKTISKVWLDVIYAERPNPPTVSAPTVTITTTRKPTTTWTFNAGTDGGGQTKMQVKIFSAAQYGAGGFNPETSSSTTSSGTVTTSSTSWTPSVNLANGTTYRAYVKTAATTNGVDQWSDWAYRQFTISIPVTAPTGLTPTNGSTVDDSTPSIAASIAAQTSGLQIRRRWDVASDAGFTSNLQSYNDPTYASTKSGTIAFPFASRLPQGTWYIRARSEDSDGQVSPWTSTNSFTIAHQPSTSNRTPTGGATVQYSASPLVDWDFSDPDDQDYQLYYKVEHWKASAPGVVTDSGKLLSGNEYHALTGIDATWKDIDIRWRVRVWDQDDAISDWSAEQSFYLRDLPTVNITAPTGAGGATQLDPTVTWTFSASAGRTQQNYRVVVTDTDASQVVADSGVVSGTATSWQMPAVISVGPNYQIQLTVTDSTGLVNTDTDTFTASYADTTPPSFIADASQYTTQSYVLIDWSSATEDANSNYWQVFRRPQGSSTWKLIHQTDDATPRSFFDYTAPANVTLEYAMVLNADQVGVPTDSAKSIRTVLDTSLASNNYWLTCPDNPSLNLKLYNVSDDSFEDEQEMSEINVVNRGRQVSYGTRFGQKGKLTTQVYDRPADGVTAREQRIAIEELRDSGLRIYLKNPFGDSWPVALFSASVKRIPGVGRHEAAIIDIDYSEVAE